MDPIMLYALAALIIFIVLKIFLGFAKMFFRLGVIVLVLVVLWRLFMANG
jgi:hypothetical protein